MTLVHPLHWLGAITRCFLGSHNWRVLGAGMMTCRVCGHRRPVVVSPSARDYRSPLA